MADRHYHDGSSPNSGTRSQEELRLKLNVKLTHLRNIWAAHPDPSSEPRLDAAFETPPQVRASQRDEHHGFIANNTTQRLNTRTFDGRAVNASANSAPAMDSPIQFANEHHHDTQYHESVPRSHLSASQEQLHVPQNSILQALAVGEQQVGTIGFAEQVPNNPAAEGFEGFGFFDLHDLGTVETDMTAEAIDKFLSIPIEDMLRTAIPANPTNVNGSFAIAGAK